MRIPAYYINLDRATARRSHMEQMAKEIDVPLNRFPAIDSDEQTDAEFRSWYPEASIRYNLTKQEVCCFLSHMKIWEIAANSDARYTAVFEDDIKLSPSARGFLENDDWLSASMQLVRLETSKKATLIARKEVPVWDNRTVCRQTGWHEGAGGYVISKEMAQSLLDNIPHIIAPVDRVLFDPQDHCLPHATFWQINPALCIQQRLSEDRFLPEQAELSRLDSARTRPNIAYMDKLKREAKVIFVQAKNLFKRVTFQHRKVKISMR